MFFYCYCSGVMTLFSAPMTSPDVLVRINVLEFVGQLCTCAHALQFLLNSGMVNQLLQLAGGRPAGGADSAMNRRGSQPDPFLGGA
jgi:hypothetical protein